MTCRRPRPYIIPSHFRSLPPGTRTDGGSDGRVVTIIRIRISLIRPVSIIIRACFWFIGWVGGGYAYLVVLAAPA